MIPHFEKMLYDNGLLLCEYARAALATGDPLYARVATQTGEWMLRDMRSPEGGFYSSLDADSEHHEGKFYVWTPLEVQSLLTESEYAVFSRRFGLNRPANFDGQWHLHAFEPLEDIAASRGESPQTAQTLIDSARVKLLQARNLRIWPARDEKILTSWNALAIKGLAIAARVLDRGDFADAATAAVDFIHHHLWREGRLLATYKDGRAHLPAYLDDYAFLLDALLELLQTRWRSRDLQFALQLIEVLLAQFEDSENGGFFFTAKDHEALIHRSKSFGDESAPAGNAIVAGALTRMGFLLAEPRYLAAAERTLRAAWTHIEEYPQAHMSFLNALEDFSASMQILIIRADGCHGAQQWADQLKVLYAPLAHDAGHSCGRERPATLAWRETCTGRTRSVPLPGDDLLSANTRPARGVAAADAAHRVLKSYRRPAQGLLQTRPQRAMHAVRKQRRGVPIQAPGLQGAGGLGFLSALRGKMCACNAGSTLP